MELFIRIVDGVPFEHPIIGDNFRQAFPGIDVDNLPPEFARFERIPAPLPGVYEINDGVTYEWENGIVKDVWHIRPMTEEEKIIKQDKAKQDWAENVGWTSWTFNEQTCEFDPPVPYPENRELYYWSESLLDWVLRPNEA